MVNPSKSNVRVFVAVTTKSLPPEASLMVAPGAPRRVSRLMPLMCKLSLQVPETTMVLASSGSKPARKLLSKRCWALLQLDCTGVGDIRPASRQLSFSGSIQFRIFTRSAPNGDRGNQDAHDNCEKSGSRSRHFRLLNFSETASKKN